MNNRKQETREQREIFIQEMAENGGDYKAAARKAGYKLSYAEKLRRTVREEIRRATAENFGDALPEAVKRLKDLMRSDNEGISLKSTLAILDRNGMEGWSGIKSDNTSQRSDDELEAMVAAWMKHRREQPQAQDDDHPEDTEKEERVLRAV